MHQTITIPQWQLRTVEDYPYIIFTTPQSIAVSRWCVLSDQSLSFGESVAEKKGDVDYEGLGVVLANLTTAQ
jgi:hypothetical protein